jgi:hypothetical protein
MSYENQNHSEHRATIWMSEELKDDVQDHVDYKSNESLSEWMRQAAADRLFLEAELAAAGIELPRTERERRAVLRDVLIEGLDEYESDE